MDKKLTGGAAAIMAALLYGGAELMGMSDRLEALEALHPELAQEKANEAAKEVEPEKPAEASEKAEPAEEPAEEPESAPEPAESAEAADPAGE